MLFLLQRKADANVVPPGFHGRTVIHAGFPDFETLQFCAFAAPGSRLAQYKSDDQNPGFILRKPASKGSMEISLYDARDRCSFLAYPNWRNNKAGICQIA